MENDTIDLTTVFALCVKKFLILLACAFFGMGIACGAFYAKSSKVDFSAQVKEYNEKVTNLKKESADLEKELAENKDLKAIVDRNISTINASDINEHIANSLSSYVDMSNSLKNDIPKLETSLKTKQDELKALVYPTPARAFSVKYAVIGFLAGGFISVVVLLVVMIGANYVTSSSDAEERLKAPLIGALYADNAFLDVVARSMMRERTWKNDEDGIKWFKQNLNSSVLPDGAKVCLLYSGSDKKAVSVLNQASSILSEKGYKVSSVSDAFKNPDSNAAIENCDAVILLERQFKSKWSCVNAVVNTVARYGKKVCALILC